MELKFLVFGSLVLFAVFGCIETGRSSGRGSSSRGSSSRGSSSRGSSSRGSSSSHSSGSSGYGSHHGGGYSPSTHTVSNSHVGSSSHTGSFLNSERGHSSSIGGRPTSSNTNTGNNNHSPFRPFGTVPPPKHNGNNNHSPFRPFATVPPPKHTGSPIRPFATVPPPKNTGSPIRPFATVPPPKNTGSPNRPFATVPPPKNTGFPRPVTPPPGIILPNSNSRPTAPPIGLVHPGIHPGTHQTGVHTRPGSHHGHSNGSSGFSPPSPGFHLPGSHNGPIGTNPSAPIQPTNYPGLGTNPGSRPNIYAPQPPYNPAFPNPGNNPAGTGFAPPAPGWRVPGSAPIQPVQYPHQGSHPGSSVPGQTHPFPNQPPPLYSPYPTNHHQTNGYINPVQTHVVHHLPPNPVQTVVVVPGQNGYHRTTGDIFKEALIHAGVNAAVHRITSPSHYHDYHNNNWNNNGFPSQGHSTVTTTNTHIVNNNYYDQNPGGTGNVAGGSNPAPTNNNPQFYPGGGVQSGSGNGFNTQGGNSGNNYPNSGNSGYNSNTGSPGGFQVLTNGQSHPNQNNGNGQVNNGYIAIYDDELFNITEKLFSLDENNASRFISLNLQKQLEANNTSNITDQSPQPLFFIQPEAYSIPTVRAIRSLYQVAAAIENKTREDSRREEALLVDLILNTNVMTAAMNFLAQKGLIKNDYYSHRDMLKNLWFTTYDGSSSGFKRIFQGEVFEGILWGIQDWIAFDFHEKSGRANYFSYVTKTDLGKSSPQTAILKTNFEMNGNTKTGTALFVGISPEMQMALYTICYHTRRDNYCDVSLGGTRVRIYTHADRYSGNDLINVAFPII